MNGMESRGRHPDSESGPVRGTKSHGRTGTSDARRPAMRLRSTRKSTAYDRRVLTALRRIVRAIDLYSRELKARCGLTVPQMVCLSALAGETGITAVDLALQVHLSPSTLVGILDRLERMEFVERERSSEDRREVRLTATPEGRRALKLSPSPLQDSLARGLERLSSTEQAAIARALERIVELMEAQELPAAPLLTLERKSYAKSHASSRRPRRESK